MLKKLVMVITILAILVPSVAIPAWAEDSVTFWMNGYGTLTDQTALLNKLASQFKAETGITVNFEIINFAQTRDKLTLISTGGPHPDVADMFWAYTYSDMGGGKYGPMPIEDVAKKELGNPEERWIPSTFADVKYKGHLYGIPWRSDARTLAYRTDYFKEAGLTRPPETWNELVEYGKKLTKVDSNGRVIRWGVEIGEVSYLVQSYYAWLWQAGGDFFSKDYKKVTLQSKAGKEALQFLVDLVYKYKVVNPAIIDPSYNQLAEFGAGKTAILTQYGSILGQDIQRSAPQLLGKVGGGLPLKNRQRVTFMGGGYFGLVYGVQNRTNALKWLEFLCRDENQLALTKVAGTISPNIKVGTDPAFTNDWWMNWVYKSIPYGKSTQYPVAAWGQITSPQPGGVIYDMLVSALSKKASVKEAIATAQKRMEELMAKY